MEEVLPLSVSAAQLHTPNEARTSLRAVGAHAGGDVCGGCTQVYKMKGQEQALKAPSELTQVPFPYPPDTPLSRTHIP
eukprot:1210860-Rhodomonas_salina.1